ncbi:hypothetical protein MACK_001245 [Theileria orientalis]|uniref:Uncharacterized protein n=1 Tax=Theileria orientalis TaxID=68886 RepID=A0A976MCP8_THEOR|nr:hypothetical protein MACK_001245 [Theileria orientalis]
MFYRLLSSSVQFAYCDNRDPETKKDSRTRSKDRKYAVEINISELTLYDLKNMVEETAKSVEYLRLLVNLKIENMELKKAQIKRYNLRHGEVNESEGSSERSEADSPIEIQEIGRPKGPHRVRHPISVEFIEDPNEDEKPEGEVVSTTVYKVDNGNREETVIVEEYKKEKGREIPVAN